MNLLRSLFKGKTRAKGAQDDIKGQSRPNPASPHFVVGDLHGMIDLLEQMLEQIDHVIGNLELRDPKLVFVGDYVDRGPSSAAVLGRLFELATEFPDNVTCILGNHEQMMLDFLDAPEARHARWFRNGAQQTLASFDINLPSEAEWAATASLVADALRSQMDPQLEVWLRSLPTSVISQNLMITHAGTDPGRAIHDQSPRVLLWGHPEFLTRTRTDRHWVAHGHTIMDNAVCADGRISVDTGGYATGCLTTAVILPDGTVEFLQTAAHP